MQQHKFAIACSAHIQLHHVDARCDAGLNRTSDQSWMRDPARSWKGPDHLFFDTLTDLKLCRDTFSQGHLSFQ